VDVEIRLLGPTEIGADGALSPRDRVILSALCVQPGEAVTAEALADALWGQAPPKSWGKVVQGSVMRLRRAVGPSAIETTAGGYRIVLPAGQLDTVEFERLVARGRSFLAVHEPERAATTLEQALALWRGPPFPELADWDRARSEGTRLLDVRRAAEEDLVEAHLAAGRAVDAAAEARPLVDREPFRERRWAMLATALYRTERQGEALDVLRRAGRTVREELGLDPGPGLVELEHRILQQDPSLLEVPNRISGASATCPYRGLRPFDTQDADFYFGRADLIAEALRRLGEVPLLLVVGPSGSGKSSLVRAGIVPAMGRAGRPVSILAPGPDPLAALTAAIAALRDGGTLVVDQLEEVFASDVAREVSRQFLNRLAAQTEGGTLVVATLRADHLGWLAESPALSRLAERGLLLLTPLSEDGLRSVIEEPARLLGLILDPGLVDLLVRDVADAPGGLPLLSHALAETWEHREGNVLTVEGYLSTGGIRSAVAHSAERLHDSLPPPDRDILRVVLQRLVAPTPVGEPVAIRVPTRVFAGSPDAPRIIDLLVRSRLVTTAQDTVTIAHESLVRAWPRLRTWLDEDLEGQRVLAHLQVTADTWDTLQRPNDELYRGARLAAALEWRQRARPVLTAIEESFLAAAAASADAERRRQERAHAHQVRHNRQLSGALATVVALLVVALVAGALAHRNDLAARAQASRADEAAVDAIAARLAVTALSEPDPGLALLLARQAEATSDSPTARGALLNGLMNAQGLVGLAQARLGPNAETFDHAVTPDGRTLLQWNSLWELHILDTITGLSRFGALADTGWGSPSWQRNPVGYPSGLIEGGRVAVLSHALLPPSPDPAWEDVSIELRPIAVSTGEPAGPPQRVPGATYAVGNDVIARGDRLRISPDGRHLVSVLEGQVRIWNRRGERWVGPRSVPVPGLSGDEAEAGVLVGASFTARGDRAAVLFARNGSPAAHRPTGLVVDLPQAQLIGSPFVQRLGLGHMAISPDGTTLLVGHADGRVQIRQVADDRVLHTVAGQSPVTIVAWSPDGAGFAIGRLDGATEVYSLDPLRRTMLSPGSERVSSLAFVGEQDLVRVSESGGIARYDLAALSPVAIHVTTAPIHALDTAAGIVAQGLDDGRVVIRDARTLKQIGGHLSLWPYGDDERTPELAAGRRVTALGLAPDGSAVIAADRLGHLRMWSLPGRELTWSRDDVPTSWLAVSPDGRYLATAGNTYRGPPEVIRWPVRENNWADPADGEPVTSTFTVWDLSTGEIHLSADLNDWHDRPTPTSVAFSPDGRSVAVAYIQGSVMVYDVAQRRRTLWLRSFLRAPSSITFSPDGQRLLATSAAYLKQADATTGAELSRSAIPGPNDVTRMAYIDRGRWLVLSHTRSVTMLDGQTLRVAVANLSLPPAAGTDALLVAAGLDHRLIVGTGTALASIDMDPERWNEAACAVVGRTLTKEEWNRFLPSVPYSPACG
jgi:DNA-binding SARP family transcriptional activator/WD40 repeat protein